MFFLLFKTFPKLEAVIRFDLSKYHVDSSLCLTVAQQILNEDSGEMPTSVLTASMSLLLISESMSLWSDGTHA